MEGLGPPQGGISLYLSTPVPPGQHTGSLTSGERSRGAEPGASARRSRGAKAASTCAPCRRGGTYVAGRSRPAARQVSADPGVGAGGGVPRGSRSLPPASSTRACGAAPRAKARAAHLALCSPRVGGGAPQQAPPHLAACPPLGQRAAGGPLNKRDLGYPGKKSCQAGALRSESGAPL